MITYCRTSFKPWQICCTTPLFSQSSSCPCHSRQMNVSNCAKCISPKAVGRLSQNSLQQTELRRLFRVEAHSLYNNCVLCLGYLQTMRPRFNSEKGGKLETEMGYFFSRFSLCDYRNYKRIYFITSLSVPANTPCPTRVTSYPNSTRPLAHTH